MEEKNNRIVYTEIPMRTWRWLGVNEGTVSQELMDSDPVKKAISVAPGATEAKLQVCRKGGLNLCEISVGEKASCTVSSVVLAPDDAEWAGELKVKVAAGGSAKVNIINLGGRSNLSSVTIELIGDESSAEINALYFAADHEKYDMNFIIRQQGKATDGRMNVYGALGGNADKIFRGTLDFVKGCSGSVGNEKEEIVLLSDGVRNRTVPLMLSGEDDVDGHHAASIGRMDEDKLFYLMSRGLDEEEAKRLVLEATFAPVVSLIDNEALRSEIEEAINRKVAKCLG